MKYRLKKDLPFAKAGEEVENVPLIGKNLIKYTDNGFGIWSVDIPKFELDSWIEEVKPREYYITLDELGGIVSCSDDDTTMKQVYKTLKVIKVREVINE